MVHTSLYPHRWVIPFTLTPVLAMGLALTSGTRANMTQAEIEKCLHIAAYPLLLIFGTLRLPCEAQIILLENERSQGAETSPPR